MGMNLYNSLLAAKLADGGDFSPSSAQLAAMNSGITADKLTTDENAIASLQEEIGLKCVLRKIKNASDTYTYTMNTADFAVTPSVGNAGTYIINVISWGTTPTYSLYAVSFSGGNIEYSAVTKIAGSDASVSASGGIISITASGKVQIFALR